MLEEVLINPFPFPSSTPATTGYPNLINSTQHAKNNFLPRKFKRVSSAQENECALKWTLKKYWGHDDFRGPQLGICMAVLGGCDVLVVAPTGLGKSVCFQVPAIAVEHGITLVVSPLLALMRDQISGLKEKDIQAGMVCHESTESEFKEVSRQLRMGHPTLRLLYITPETLFGNKLRAALDIAFRQKQLVRLVIDEAHVIDEWGSSFRPGYRQLGEFRERFHGIPVTALTASATEEVRADILKLLGIPKKDLAQWVEPFNRKNLFYEIRYRGNVVTHSAKVDDLADFITKYRPEAQRKNVASGIKMPCVSGLCEDVANHLLKRGIKARYYHALAKDKEQALADWKSGRVECIVATIAFGMGVDMPHVRYVVHYEMPKSFEGYYQETGRAGRDGHASRCILYYEREDAKRQRNLIAHEADTAVARQKLLRENAAKSGKTSAWTEKDDQETTMAKARCGNSFKLLQQYAEATEICRHVAICKYFGEMMDHADAEIRKSYCDGMCDVCTNLSAVRRRAAQVSEDVDLLSQVIRPVPPAASAADPTSSAGVPPHNSLAQLHGPTASHAGTAAPSFRSTTVSEGRRQVEPPLRCGNGVSTPDTRSTVQPKSTGSSTVPVKQSCVVSTGLSAGIAMTRSKPPSKWAALPRRQIPRTPTAGPSRTVDDMIDSSGGYAVPGRQPLDPQKRQRQEDAFKSVRPVSGEGGGPFPCYGSGDAIQAQRRRKNSSQAKVPFKVPFLEGAVATPAPAELHIIAPAEPLNAVIDIPRHVRSPALQSMQSEIRETLVRHHLANKLWSYWGRTETGEQQTAILKRVVRVIESETANASASPEIYNIRVGKVVWGLRHMRSIHIVNDILQGHYEGDVRAGQELKPFVQFVEGRVKST